MAYQTGTVADPIILLDEIKAFAELNGYAVNGEAEFIAGNYNAGKTLHLEKGEACLNLRSFIDTYDPTYPTYRTSAYSYSGIMALPSRSYDPSKAWHLQDPDVDKWGGVFLPSKNLELKYFFFAFENPNMLVVCVKYNPDAEEYGWLIWGDTDQSPNGATFLTGLMGCSQIMSSSSTNKNYLLNTYRYKYLPFNTRFKSNYGANITLIKYPDGDRWAKYDGDPATGDFVGTSIGCSNDANTSFPNYSNYPSDGTGRGLAHRSRCPSFTQRPLIPIQFWGTWEGKWSYLGAVQNMHAIHAGDLVAEQEFAIAENNFIVLPAWKMDWAETSLANEQNFQLAFAIKTN